MIDFMLKNSCVPSRGLDALGIPAVVKAFNPYVAVTWNQCKKAWQAEAAFEEFRDLAISRVVDSRIDDHVESDRPPFAQGQLFGGNILVVFLTILDHGQLQRQTNLRRCQTHAGRPAHGFPHMFDYFLNLFAFDFFRRKSACRLPENRFSGMDDR